MSESIPLTDWNKAVKALTAFSDKASVDNDTVTIEFARAHVIVRRDGYVSTGMPLHDFTYDAEPDGVSITIDEKNGELQINIEDVSYTFRRP